MSLTGLDLNLLVVLDTVLAERSVVRAARRLHVTPSAVSNSLARLREALSDPLVIRSGRGVVPTPRAAALLPALGRALRDLEGIVQGERFDPELATNHFSLAIADVGQIVQLPKLAADFSRKLPRAALRIVGIDTLVSTGGLAGTEVDVAIAGLDDSTAGVHSLRLYEEQSVLAARGEHPRLGAALSVKQLSGLRHVEVQVAPGRGYRDLAGTYARAGITRQVVLVVPCFVAAAAVIAETDLVTTLPESFVQRFGKSFGVRALSRSAPRVTVAVNLAWHDRTDQDPAMRAFRELVASSIRGSRKIPSKRKPATAVPP